MTDDARSPYYFSPRHDMIELIPGNTQRILEVGCAGGATGKELKERGVKETVGIEVVKEIARRGLDSTISTTNLISISEHLYKVSGLSAKLEPKPSGPGFSIQIILGDSPSTQKTITIGETPIPLGEVPEFMLATSGGNLEEIV